MAIAINVYRQQKFQAALHRAAENALDVYVSTDGSAFVESASQPGLLYSVSREGCDCKAGQRGMICQHYALYLLHVGELPLGPAPAAAPVARERLAA